MELDLDPESPPLSSLSKQTVGVTLSTTGPTATTTGVTAALPHCPPRRSVRAPGVGRWVVRVGQRMTAAGVKAGALATSPSWCILIGF